MVRIKTKISLGIGFLFAVILVIGGLGIVYLKRLDNDAQAIIKDNIRTLSYTQKMSKLLGEIQAELEEELIIRSKIDTTLVNRQRIQNSINAFEEFLEEQDANITEPGEKNITESIRKDYNNFLTLISSPLDLKTFATQGFPLIRSINSSLSKIYDINQAAVFKKNEKAQATAQHVTNYMLVIGSFSALIALLILILFPNYIIRPIKKLNQSMQRIAAKNYEQRIDIKSKDEYGELATSFNTMAEKLREYDTTNLTKILLEKKRTESIINKMSEAIIGLDENKYVLFANPSALEILGMEEKDLIGKYAPEIANYNAAMRELIQEIMIGFCDWEEEKYKPLEICMNDKDCYFSKEIMDVTLKDTGEDFDRLVGHVIILKNMTQMKEMDRAKTNFMSAVSHELKTPISSIKMSLQLLEDDRIGKLNEEQKELFSYIKEESERLLNITKDMKNLAQAKSGNIQINAEPVSPDDIVNYALHTVKSLAEDRKVILEYPLSTDLPDVEADSEKVVWVMGALLTNAIENSFPEKKVIVDVSEKNNKIQFSVEDFGERIPENQLEKIFDKFYPGSNQTPTGLEMAVLKEYIEQQNGNIWVEAKEGFGNKFCFTLPYATQQKAKIHKS